MKKDFIIIGAGLSGLACALTLKKMGFESTIIEAENVVGGRVRTHTTGDGFIIDEGFQVILNSYPEFQNFIDLEKLSLRKFNSGALIFEGNRLVRLANPLAHPGSLFSTLLNPFTSLKDQALVIKLILNSQFYKNDSPLGDNSTESFLKSFGFSENFIEFFWRPFLTGVFLDPQLSIGDQFFKFLLRCFASGNISIPENGISQLPLQLAAQLPADSIFLNRPVQSWNADTVSLKNGEKLSARNVICAFDATATKSDLGTTSYHSVTTHYFTGPKLAETNWGKWLILVPSKINLGISHMCLISNISEKYGNSTHPLLSVSVVGNNKVSLDQIKQEIDKIAQTDLQLKLVTSTAVSKALPIYPKETQGFKVIDGVMYCGDQWASPSINGALRSGRLAAEFLVKQMR